MEENTKPIEEEADVPALSGDLRKVKALSINITKILEENKDAASVNVYYVITDGELDIKGMEIVGSTDGTEQSF